MDYLVSKSFVPKSAEELAAEEAGRAESVSDAKASLETSLRALLPENESVKMSFQSVVNLARSSAVPNGWILSLDDVRAVVQKLALEWHPEGMPPLEEQG